MTTETARAVRPKGSAFRRQSPGAKLAGRSACMSGMARSSPGPGPHSLRLDRNQFPSWKVVMARSRRARAFSGKRTRWMKGCSSLGRLRFAVLLEAESSRTGRGWVCLVDLKEAIPAAAPRHTDIKTPRDNAERVVEGARYLASHLGECMVEARLLDHSVFLRELLPQDLEAGDRSTHAMGGDEGHSRPGTTRGHRAWPQAGRTGAAKWRAEIGRNRSKRLDAPSWSWSNIGGLVASLRRLISNIANAMPLRPRPS